MFCITTEGLDQLASSDEDWVSGYDSVHSIQVPLHTYENQLKQHYHHGKRETAYPNLSKATQDIRISEFELIERTFSLEDMLPNVGLSTSPTTNRASSTIKSNDKKGAGRFFKL